MINSNLSPIFRGAGTCTIITEEITSNKEVVEIHLAAKDLDKKDLVDIYLSSFYSILTVKYTHVEDGVLYFIYSLISIFFSLDAYS